MIVRSPVSVTTVPPPPHVRGMPLRGLENPRPAVQKAGEFRIDAKDLPFDPAEFLKNESEYNPSLENWGSGEN